MKHARHSIPRHGELDEHSSEPVVARRSAAEHTPAGPQAEPMKCVWSGHPSYRRDCRSRIPASVVVKAWHREMQLKGTVEGFFYFSWRHGVWLAYGLRDGGVRGVYCPTHCSERDSRGEQSNAGPATDAPALGDPPRSTPRAVRSARVVLQ